MVRLFVCSIKKNAIFTLYLIWFQDGTRVMLRDGKKGGQRHTGGRVVSTAANSQGEDDATIFMCGFCEKLFSSPQEINQHIQEHTTHAAVSDVSAVDTNAFDTTSDLETISLSVNADEMSDGTQSLMIHHE